MSKRDRILEKFIFFAKKIKEIEGIWGIIYVG